MKPIRILIIAILLIAFIVGAAVVQVANAAEGGREYEYLGCVKFTHYCPGACCGSGSGRTASGTKATPGRTIAVDPDVIPLGSTVYFGGKYYIAEDTGGAVNGRKIDVCVATHAEARRLGVRWEMAWIVKGGIER